MISVRSDGASLRAVQPSSASLDGLGQRLPTERTRRLKGFDLRGLTEVNYDLSHTLMIGPTDGLVKARSVRLLTTYYLM